MAGSHVEEGGKQVWGKDSGPSTRGRKDKSRDAISSLKGRFVRLELGVADTNEGMDFFWSKSWRRPWRISRCKSKTFKSGCKAHRFMWCHTRSS